MLFIQNVNKDLELRVNIPEFTFKRNIAEPKCKSLFIHDTGNSVEEAIELAKDQACKIGMGDRALLQVEDITYSARKKGWQILVQKRL